ncbi:hypothetical protein [Lentzea flaviverrucosa]|uniref:Uncharacterized protein n=1 Tax=Lentzea flaviverrucosa TaxID=200379 RepID=A0A1H9XX64_9PSEU|nr:hypothetical protein [Lentzea flaviverrucosa]RDI17150.1 hypothetical protein DFR72_122113 [Lentzea flaviverrucosa]SES50778.1 hypothetical protein SAMN05216195_12216 [Lentzea flaviverrucosa]
MRLKSTFGRVAVIACAVLFTLSSTAVANASRGRECATPSIDRLQQWIASGEGATEPATGSILVPKGRHGYTAKIKFLADDWAVMVVWLGNEFEAEADLSDSHGFWMTYRATSDLYIQLRPASFWSGGDKWVTKVPSTGGKLVKRFFSFKTKNWTYLPALGKPSYPLADALDDARGLVFVGNTKNDLEFQSLEIDGYRPPCVH